MWGPEASIQADDETVRAFLAALSDAPRDAEAQLDKALLDRFRAVARRRVREPFSLAEFVLFLWLGFLGAVFGRMILDTFLSPPSSVPPGLPPFIS